MATVLIVPAVAVPLYLKVGNPALPDVPLQARIDRAAETGDFDAAKKSLATLLGLIGAAPKLTQTTSETEPKTNAPDAKDIIARLTTIKPRLTRRSYPKSGGSAAPRPGICWPAGSPTYRRRRRWPSPTSSSGPGRATTDA